MKRVSQEQVSKWSIEKNEKKTEWLRGLFLKKHAVDLAEFEDAMHFLDFLDREDSYKYSRQYYRYLVTMTRVLRYCPKLDGIRILETGGVSPLSEYLQRRNECYHTETDLRIEFDCEDDFADLLFSLEVFEHIKDVPEKDFREVVLFQESGVIRFAEEAFRVVKPGGYFVLTTPNACSAYVLDQLLQGKPPMLFRPHVREYTKSEILKMFAPFELVHYESMFIFFFLGDHAAQLIKNLAALGGSPDDRGDDHFFVFRKPINA